MNQEKIYEMQMLEQQIGQIQQILENIDVQINEIRTTKDALTEFKSLKEGSELLFPLANGIFAKGILGSDKKLKVNVGNNVVVEKTADETIVLMNTQLTELETYKNEVSSQMEKMILKLQEN